MKRTVKMKLGVCSVDISPHITKEETNECAADNFANGAMRFIIMWA
jgi:hypothetical protein